MNQTDIYRILTPSEYKALLKSILKLDNRMRVETMMNTGMRYRELQDFGKHPEWFRSKDRCIVIPGASLKQGKSEKTQTRKKKIQTRDRTVHLTPQFSEKLEMYLSSYVLKFPDRKTMKTNLRRWHYIAVKKDNNGIWQQCNVESWILPKTFRKTWETYLIRARVYHWEQRDGTYYELEDIDKSQGHKHGIAMQHYYNSSACLKDEKELAAVLELTRGWMT